MDCTLFSFRALELAMAAYTITNNNWLVIPAQKIRAMFASHRETVNEIMDSSHKPVSTQPVFTWRIERKFHTFTHRQPGSTRVSRRFTRAVEVWKGWPGYRVNAYISLIVDGSTRVDPGWRTNPGWEPIRARVRAPLTSLSALLVSSSFWLPV